LGGSIARGDGVSVWQGLILQIADCRLTIGELAIDDWRFDDWRLTIGDLTIDDLAIED
jgi:hypothetical protein